MDYAGVTEAGVRVRMAAMAARGGYFNCVAEVNGEAAANAHGEAVANTHAELAGVLSARRGVSLEMAGEKLEILLLAVHPRWQRRGLGRALMERAEAEAARDGVRYFTLTSGLARSGAHAFYEARGYRRQGYRFAKGLKF